MKEFNSKYSPVNVHNDEQMVRECLRLPKLQIDRKAFQKTFFEKEALWTAKLVWRAEMRRLHHGVARSEYSGRMNKYSQSGINF